jgi:hypothetical protein
VNPPPGDQTTSSQSHQPFPFDVLEDTAVNSAIPLPLARHAHETDGGPHRPPALFEYFYDHPEWEATAYLLELPLVRDKVEAAVGPGPHEVMCDFDAVLIRCHSESEKMIVRAARDIWRGEGAIGAMRAILDRDNFDAVVTSMRIAREGRG